MFVEHLIKEFVTKIYVYPYHFTKQFSVHYHFQSKLHRIHWRMRVTAEYPLDTDSGIHQMAVVYKVLFHSQRTHRHLK